LCVSEGLWEVKIEIVNGAINISIEPLIHQDGTKYKGQWNWHDIQIEDASGCKLSQIPSDCAGFWQVAELDGI
jgi:hypothetical protein